MNYSFSKEAPIAIIAVNLVDKQEKIMIYKNDKIDQVALKFCEEYHLDKAFVPEVIKSIQLKINNPSKAKLQTSARNTEQKEISKENLSEKSLIKENYEQFRQPIQTLPDLFDTKSKNVDTPLPRQSEKEKNIASHYENWFQIIRTKQDEMEKHNKIFNLSKPNQLKAQKDLVMNQFVKQHSATPSSRDSKVLKMEDIFSHGKFNSFKQLAQFGTNEQRKSSKSRTPRNRSSKSYYDLPKSVSKINQDRVNNNGKPTRSKRQDIQRKEDDQKLKQQEFVVRQQQDLKQKQDTLNELRRQKNQLIDEVTGQALFKPKIVKDQIFQKVKQKQDQEDLKLSKILTNKQSHAKPSAQIQPDSPKKQLKKIESIKQLSEQRLVDLFKQMDDDKDGQISNNQVNVSAMDPSDLYIISEVLFQMEDTQSTFNLQQFIDVCKSRDILLIQQPSAQKAQEVVVEQISSRVQQIGNQNQKIPKKYQNLLDKLS